MSAINVVARMYDPTSTAVNNEVPSAEKGFDQVIQSAVDTSNKNTECPGCAATNAAAETKEVAAESEINHSAAYRFTMFVRVSGDIGGMSQTLADEFRSLTKGFIGELIAEKDTGVNALDSYLGQAETAVSKGFASTKSLVDDMLNAADYGLKSVIASMTSNSWISSLGGSTSSAMTGTSMADVAKIYLQDSVNSLSNSSGTVNSKQSSSAGAVSYGGGFQLQMVGATEPIKIVPADSGSSVGSETTDTNAISSKNKILERFLQLLEDITGSVGGKVIKAEYTMSYSEGALSRDKDVKEAATAQVVNVADETSEKNSGQAEEVLI